MRKSFNRPSRPIDELVALPAVNVNKTSTAQSWTIK